MKLSDKINTFVSRHFFLLMASAFVIALLLRFVRLGTPSLTDMEAERALQALSLVRGESTSVGGQPGYIGLTSLLFLIFEPSSFTARFLPALIGALLALVPRFYRRQFKDLTCVLLAFLAAFEPGLVALSRSADGTIITITCLLAAIGFVLSKKFIPAGITLGLAIIGSEQFLALSITLLLAWILTFSSSGKKVDGWFKDLISDLEHHWWKLMIAAALTALLVSSAFFLYPQGISGIGSTITDYFREWNSGSKMPLSTFASVMLVTQFPAIVIALWGLLNGLIVKSRAARFLGLWWLISLTLGLLNPSHNGLTLGLVNLPIFILAALQINSLMDGIEIPSSIVSLIEGVITISLLLFSALNFLNLVNYPPADGMMLRNRIIGIFLPLALWAAFSMLLAWGWDSISTRSGLLIGLGLMAGAILIGAGWKSAGLGYYPQNELQVNSAYITGANGILQTTNDVARWSSGMATRIDVDLAGLDSPSIRWVFRDFEKVTQNPVFPLSNSPSIVVSKPEAILQTQNLYRGQPIVWSVQPDYAQMTWRDWVKWFFLRQVPQDKETVILWVRNDLFKGGAAQIQ